MFGQRELDSGSVLERAERGGSNREAKGRGNLLTSSGRTSLFSPPSDSYDLFAWFYDRHWAGIFFEEALRAVEALLLSNVPVRGRVLDLCCGTGQLASELGRRGYRVTCVDRSGEMLRLAKLKPRVGCPVQADARALPLRAAHEGAVCLFDSLNHILEPQDLANALKSVRSTLFTDASFLFDLNTELAFRERWVERYSMETQDGTCHLAGAYEPATRIGRYRVALLGRGRETWRSADFEILERCHPEDEVTAALSAAGFDSVQSFDAEKDLDMPEQIGRVFYLARAC